jgi:hypothetical protein
MQFVKIISASSQNRMKTHKYALCGKCSTVPLTRRNRTIKGQSAHPKSGTSPNASRGTTVV